MKGMTIMFRGKRKFVLLLLLIAVVGGLFYRSRNGNGNGATTTIERGNVVDELILSGEVKADEHAVLKFKTSGEIDWIGVSEGDWVKKGKKLAQIDARTLDSALQMARADLRAAEAKLARTYDDLKGHDVDETFPQRETRTTVETTKDKAYEAVIVAEENLKGATLYAPFAGMVTYLATPYTGVNLLYTEAVVELVNPQTIYFEVAADQTEVTKLKVGQEVKILLDSFPDISLSGEILSIGFTPKAGEAGAVYRIKVSLTPPEGQVDAFRIGMTGDARFILSQKEDILYIPPEFINTNTEGTYIKVGDKNNKTYIETGLEGEERVEVKGTIKEGDIVFD